jgi:phage baseplate assembly protein W
MPNGFNVKQPLKASNVDGAFELIKEPTPAIKQNLKFLVLTSPGERIRVPSFGVGLHRYLFENLTPALQNTIRQRIVEQANQFMPYIQITAVLFDDSKIDENLLSVQINYVSRTSTAFSDFLILEVTI